MSTPLPTFSPASRIPFQPLPAPHPRGPSAAEDARAVIDLSNHNSFSLCGSAPACILAAFGAGPMHAHVLTVECDLERAVLENERALVRSRRYCVKDAKSSWGELIFRFAGRLFLYAESSRIVAFAEDCQSAEQLASEFTDKYKQPPARTGGSFQLIKIQDGQIDTVTVTLEASTMMSDETLDLHYGNGFIQWHRSYTQGLASCGCGLSILQGAPGTGKTSYLRHLMAALKESHRFYYIQPSHMFMLAKPEFVQFWASQRRNYPERRFVIMLEDAEEAVMRRGSDNSAHVSAILNLSDGLLGDFIQLHMLCTMNCAATEIDPALLRPGRLLSQRVFERLSRQAAAELARQLGKELRAASDYSLAEIFAGHSAEVSKQPRIGFA